MIFNKVRISGTMPGGEVWSINPCFGVGGGTEAVEEYGDLLEWATDIASLNTNKIFPAAPLEILSTAARITQVRTEFYDPTGKLTQVAEIGATSAAVGSFTPNKPFQSAMVVSLRTGRAGRSYRGRLYLPALNVTLTPATLRIDPAIRNGVSSQMAAWLRDIANVAPGVPRIDPVVVSQTIGVVTGITNVEVGDILDTQRRRRDSLEEAYFSTDIPAPPA